MWHHRRRWGGSRRAGLASARLALILRYSTVLDRDWFRVGDWIESAGARL